MQTLPLTQLAILGVQSVLTSFVVKRTSTSATATQNGTLTIATCRALTLRRGSEYKRLDAQPKSDRPGALELYKTGLVAALLPQTAVLLVALGIKVYCGFRHARRDTSRSANGDDDDDVDGDVDDDIDEEESPGSKKDAVALTVVKKVAPQLKQLLVC